MKTPSDGLALVGDACLFTAAAFCPLALAGGPLALVAGPAAAWLLHERRIDRAAAISGLMSIAISVVAVGGFFAVAQLVSSAVGPVGGWEFAGPAAFLAAAGAVFLALVVALDIDGLRDLLPARRRHIRLDYARLVSTLVLAVFAAVVSIAQRRYPEAGVGDAGVFALGAGAVGAVTMLVMRSIHAFGSPKPQSGQH